MLARKRIPDRWTVEGAKEQLGRLKVLISVLAVSLGSVIGWVFQNFRRASSFDIAAACLATTITSVIAVDCLMAAFTCINQLHRLRSPTELERQ